MLTDSCTMQSKAPFTSALMLRTGLSGSISRKVETHRFPLGKGHNLYFNSVFLKIIPVTTQLAIVSKDSIQESTQKPSIYTLNEDNDNSFFSPPTLYFEKVKPTGRLQEKYSEYPYTIQLDWPIVNILPHLCLLSVCA